MHLTKAINSDIFPHIQIRVFADPAELMTAEHAYRSLFDACNIPHIYSSFPYLMADASARRKGQEWRCFAAFRGDTMVGCLFGYRTQRNVLGFTLSVFEIGTGNVCDPLLETSEDQSTLGLLIDAMLEDQADCTLFTFKRMPPPAFHLVHDTLSHSRKRFVWRWAGYGYKVDTSCSEDEFLSSLSRKRRKTINQRQRQLFKTYPAEYRLDHKSGVEPNMERFEEFMCLEDSGWKGKKKSSILHRQDYEPYFREIVRHAGHAGLLVWYSLCIDDKPIAMQFCLRSHNTLWIPKIAYDEQFSRYGPGILVTHFSLLDCVKQKSIVEMNNISGTPWFADWKPSRIEYRTVHLFGKTVRSRLVHALLKSRDFALHKLMPGDPDSVARNRPYL